jgi:hypothetical protein
MIKGLKETLGQMSDKSLKSLSFLGLELSFLVTTLMIDFRGKGLAGSLSEELVKLGIYPFGSVSTSASLVSELGANTLFFIAIVVI